MKDRALNLINAREDVNEAIKNGADGAASAQEFLHTNNLSAPTSIEILKKAMEHFDRARARLEDAYNKL